MWARMDFSLIVVLGFGAGALLLGIAARRRAERPVPRPRDGPASTVEAGQAPAIAEPSSCGPSTSEQGVLEADSAAAVSAPERGDPEGEAPAAPPEIPEQARANRRKYPRIRSDQTFVITPFAGRAIMAQCFDLSAGGMRFGIVGCTLRPGDLVRVTFNVGAETVAAIGSVLRVRELDPITSEVSLEFVRLDPWASQLLEQALEAEV